jgi:hypothetical protein
LSAICRRSHANFAGVGGAATNQIILLLLVVAVLVGGGGRCWRFAWWQLVVVAV